jgi:uncharacterized protein (TIGR03663 family)
MGRKDGALAMNDGKKAHPETLQRVPPPPRVLLPWLTVEVALYGLLVLAALAARLAGLGRWPLLESEANTALAAWRAARGLSWQWVDYSPLIFDLTLLLAALTRASDAAVRLLPALVGAGLVALPYFARDILGRKGALLAALLLAFAPTWFYFSRTADGPILTTAASALVLLAIHRYWGSQRPQHLRLAVIALALGLAAGPGMYTPILAGALWVLLRHRAGEADQRHRVWRAVVTRANLLLGLGVFLLCATGLLLNLGGLGAAVELAGRWVRSLGPASSGLPWTAYPLTLVTYESLTLVLALVGSIWGLARREALDGFLSLWVGLALLLGTLLGHREPLWLADALLPLLILAARGFQRLWDRLAPGAQPIDVLLILATLAFLALAFLRLAAFAQTGQTPYLAQSRVVLGALILIWAFYGIWGQRDVALRVAVVALVVSAAVITVRATSALAYQTGRDPRERMVFQPSSVAIRDLEALVTKLSSEQTGDPHTLDITYDPDLDPLLGWYLRDYPQARPVAGSHRRPQATVLITRALEKSAWPQGYAGQRFRWQEVRVEQKLSLREQLRWLFYRYPVGEEKSAEVHVWVRLPTAP